MIMIMKIKWVIIQEDLKEIILSTAFGNDNTVGKYFCVPLTGYSIYDNAILAPMPLLCLFQKQGRNFVHQPCVFGRCSDRRHVDTKHDSVTQSLTGYSLLIKDFIKHVTHLQYFLP